MLTTMLLDGTSQSGRLRDDAVGIFGGIFPAIDPIAAVASHVAVTDNGRMLVVGGERIDLGDFDAVYAVALGKAAASMAAGLDRVIGPRLSAGVVTAAAASAAASSKVGATWTFVEGGHPLPTAGSLAAGKAAAELLRRADDPRALVFFLVSGGGSAMLEIPAAPSITLDDLRKTNRLLVGCGAPIAEMNRVRRAISSVKGGQLGRIAGRARRFTLIVSDTNAGDEASVASGPTIKPETPGENEPNALEIAAARGILARLPKSVREHLEDPGAEDRTEAGLTGPHSIATLLGNRTALAAAAEGAIARGYAIGIADDLVETPVEQGCRALVDRLARLRAEARGRPVALISGGEFSCPVRGDGIGGRNLETTLRCLLEFAERSWPAPFGVLSAGTDGIDGNSPAAGAVADGTSLMRAAAAGIDPAAHLASSDAYGFFAPLGDALVTGPSGTNVRDVRILLSL